MIAIKSKLQLLTTKIWIFLCEIDFSVKLTSLLYQNVLWRLGWFIFRENTQRTRKVQTFATSSLCKVLETFDLQHGLARQSWKSAAAFSVGTSNPDLGDSMWSHFPYDLFKFGNSLSSLSSVDSTVSTFGFFSIYILSCKYFLIFSLKPLHLHTVSQAPSNGQNSNFSVAEMERLIHELKIRLDSLSEEVIRLQKQISPSQHNRNHHNR